MLPIFALTTRGLEAVSGQEMAALPGMTITQQAYRRIAAVYPPSRLSRLLGPRTVDDVYVEVATWQNIGRPRSILADLAGLCTELDLTAAVDACASIRPIPDSPAFSITASFVGKRNYTSDEIKTACADGISNRHGWTYTADDSTADLNLRIFIEHELAYVGLRLSKSPLHDRDYKRLHLPGSLKPPVAAAMFILAEVKPGMRLLDPCCGAGTILIEAARMGASAIGGDTDPLAVDAARKNAEFARAAIDARIWDAQSLPLTDASVERIITNLPWGRQIVPDDLKLFYQRACAEMRRVLMPGGRIAILTSLPEQMTFPDLRLEQTLEISLYGQTPRILIYTSP